MGIFKKKKTLQLSSDGGSSSPGSQGLGSPFSDSELRAFHDPGKYVRYKDPVYFFSAEVPKKWSKQVIDDGGRHVCAWSVGPAVLSITIRTIQAEKLVSRGEEVTLQKFVQWAERERRSTNPDFVVSDMSYEDKLCGLPAYYATYKFTNQGDRFQSIQVIALSHEKDKCLACSLTVPDEGDMYNLKFLQVWERLLSTIRLPETIVGPQRGTTDERAIASPSSSAGGSTPSTRREPPPPETTPTVLTYDDADEQMPVSVPYAEKQKEMDSASAVVGELRMGPSVRYVAGKRMEGESEAFFETALQQLADASDSQWKDRTAVGAAIASLVSSIQKQFHAKNVALLASLLCMCHEVELAYGYVKRALQLGITSQDLVDVHAFCLRKQRKLADFESS